MSLLGLPECPVVPALRMLERDFAPAAFSSCWDDDAGIAWSDPIGEDGPVFIVAVWRWDGGYLATTVSGRKAKQALFDYIDPQRRLPMVHA